MSRSSVRQNSERYRCRDDDHAADVRGPIGDAIHERIEHRQYHPYDERYEQPDEDVVDDPCLTEDVAWMIMDVPERIHAIDRLVLQETLREFERHPDENRDYVENNQGGIRVSAMLQEGLSQRFQAYGTQHDAHAVNEEWLERVR